MAFFACLPVVLFATYLSVNDIRASHRATDDSATVIATSIRHALDGELKAAISAMKVLAASRNLGDQAAADSLAEFYAEAVDFVASHGTNILLIERDGTQVLNTRRPLGAALPKTNAPKALSQVIATGQPLVTDVFVGAVLQQPLVAIEVPVIRRGLVQRVLALNLLTDDIQKLVARAPRPEGWGLAVLDSEGRFVARSRKAAAGELARPGLPEAVASVFATPPSAAAAAAAEASMYARRKVPRAAYATPVRLLGNHGVMEGRIEDISTRGVLVVAPKALDTGAAVQLSFALPTTGAMVQTAAVIRWVRVAPASQRAAMGFEFQVPPTALRVSVDEYILQHEGHGEASGGGP